MSRVAIVTDSTCDLGPLQLDEIDVRMVPLKVLFGEETLRDWIDIEPEAFYARLQGAKSLPKTSQPSPAEFLEAYQACADEGHEAIVSLHLSSPLSGTVNSALVAAEESPIPVHVVDTKEVSQALGNVVKAAAAARDQGLDAAAVAQRATEVAESTSILFVLDTLEYLVKGGRAGKAQGLAAALLNIKPVLMVNDEGIVAPFKKVKGRRRALAEIAAHVAEVSREKGSLSGTILHACLPDQGDELTEALQSAGADITLDPPGLVGAVIGTYTGPGALGIAFHPI